MKKVFLLSLSLVLGFSAFAQNRVMKNDAQQGVAKANVIAVGNDMTATEASSYAPQAAKSVVINRWLDIEDAETMWTSYDLQSNQFVANRMFQMPNGNVAVVATMSHEENLTASDRGTGYNFLKNGSWGDEPDERFEPWKTGWPSIAPYGANGEILLCHGNSGMQCFVRETAGEGEWQYKGALPAYPEGYPYTTEYATWPRVVTCGPNHNIIVAVAALQHSISSDETDVRTCYWRSEDAETWTCSYGPLADLGLGYEVGNFSADDYCMAANGNTVALMYSGCLTQSVWMFKSEDCGLTWTPTRVWEHPFEGVELDEPGLDYGDTLFMPMNSTITIDNNGVVHAAFNTFEMTHLADTDPGYYSYWYGRAVDGILYWNDTMDPIHDTDHPEYIGTPYEEHFAQANQFHAARLWWPIADEIGYVHMLSDSTKWIGFVPMYYDETGALIQWDNSNYYRDNYHSKLYGTSGHPALSCDPAGNLACAFTSPCTKRISGDGNYYFRSIYASYYNATEGYWHQDEDEFTDDEYNPMYMFSENLFTFAAPNTVNVGEFWFAFQSDDKIGFAWGGSTSNPATQTATSVNEIHVVKVMSEHVGVEETAAQDVVYQIYPNPATDYIMVSSAMDANATITFVNLAGQTVKSISKALTTGENAISIDLESGIYFCTVNANGFNKTTKVIVK